MIDVAMGFGIGFLMASLLTLIVAPFIHERAVDLTTRQLMAVTPSSSLIEAQVERDLLRAEFAMTVYRLEARLAATRTKDVALFDEIAKKAAEIGRLKAALGEKSAEVVAYQAREQMRRSVVQRVVKLSLWMFDRSYRRKDRALSGAMLEQVTAPPLQAALPLPNVGHEPAPQDDPLPSVVDRLLAPPQLTLGLRSDTLSRNRVLADLRRITLAQ
jgi:hypothetical protein